MRFANPARPRTGTVAGSVVSETVSPIANITYTLTVTDPGNVCPAATDQVDVDVVQPPVAYPGVDQWMCPGVGTVTIGGTGNLQNGYNYQWTPGVGGVVTGGSVDMTVGPLNTTTNYLLTVTDPNNICPPDVQSVTVNVYQPLQISPAPLSTTICQAASATYTITTTGGSGMGMTYYWDGVPGPQRRPTSARPLLQRTARHR